MGYQALQKHEGTFNVYHQVKASSLKRYLLRNSTYITFWKRQNYGEGKQISGARGWER